MLLLDLQWKCISELSHIWEISLLVVVQARVLTGSSFLLIMAAHWQDREICDLLNFYKEEMWRQISATVLDAVIYEDITSLGYITEGP